MPDKVTIDMWWPLSRVSKSVIQVLLIDWITESPFYCVAFDIVNIVH